MQKRITLSKHFLRTHAVPIPFRVAFGVGARARSALGFSAEEQARLRACCAAFVR